ncbi:helix-turn-helix domain-containing protein [Micromonospora humida]|uniref:helix-turn-helix domain-containing protein n=1 Tax=Micromonospora humida TaxID=2809018 RepID=UPI00340FE9B4
MTDPTAAEVRRPGVGAPPARTRRPAARDELRAAAVVLRGEGRSVGDIAARLGVAKSTAYLWVRHLPLDPNEEVAARRRARARAMNDDRWATHRATRDAAQAEVHSRMRETVGLLADREVLLLGAALYWCEGTKSKPWRRHEHVQFVNTDAGLLRLFLRFLAACGVERDVPTYRVSIHESADAAAAQRWWAETLDLPPDRFRRPTLKHHQPTTRHNTGESYHGCLVVDVPKSRELYWKIEGVVAALTGEIT